MLYGIAGRAAPRRHRGNFGLLPPRPQTSSKYVKESEFKVSNAVLYVAAILIWGSTWIAIKFQLGVVPPAVSVMWRFLAAAAILFAVAGAKRLPLRFSRVNHLWMLLQGLLLFCLNYIGFYLSEQHLASGLVAVLCSLLAIGNIVGSRVFFGVKTHFLNLTGALVGIIGVALLFWPELRAFSVQSGSGLGIVFGLAATLSASLGNMVATRNQRQALPIIQMTGWSMLYGAVLTAMLAVATGQRCAFDWSWAYIISLAYLAVFGSVLAFLAYLTLLGRIGANRAGYSMVATPVVALLISTALEGIRWSGLMMMAVALCVVGNLMVLRRDASRQVL